MNSPTIAAVVPGLKAQSGRPAANDNVDSSSDGSFANVLAGQTSGAQDTAKPDTATAGVNDTARDDVATAEPDTLPTDPRQSADEQGESSVPDELLGALPQIALEIALHARDQAAARGRTAAGVEGDAKQAASDAPLLKRSAEQAGKIDVRVQPEPSRASDAAQPVAQEIGADTVQPKSAPAANLAPNASLAEFAQPMNTRAHRHQTEAAASVPSVTSANVPDIRGNAATTSNASRRGGDAAPAITIETLASASAAQVQGEAHGFSPAATGPDASGPASTGVAAFNPFATQLSSAAAPSTAVVATPLNQPGWSTDFSRQVVTLARDVQSGIQTAELRLDPPDLGPLRISISLNDGMASAMFVSAHASVRQAIESALPQLSQQLAQAGISLGDTHVGDQGQAAFGGQDGSSQGSGRSVGTGHLPGSAAEPASPAPVIASNALVDTFA